MNDRIRLLDLLERRRACQASRRYINYVLRFSSVATFAATVRRAARRQPDVLRHMLPGSEVRMDALDQYLRWARVNIRQPHISHLAARNRAAATLRRATVSCGTRGAARYRLSCENHLAAFVPVLQRRLRRRRRKDAQS